MILIYVRRTSIAVTFEPYATPTPGTIRLRARLASSSSLSGHRKEPGSDSSVAATEPDRLDAPAHAGEGKPHSGEEHHHVTPIPLLWLPREEVGMIYQDEEGSLGAAFPLPGMPLCRRSTETTPPLRLSTFEIGRSYCVHNVMSAYRSSIYSH